jgi:hypothetical protein
MEISITALTAADEARLKQQRAVIERHLTTAALPKYATAAGKLSLLQALLKANVFSPQQTYPLQCMGVVLGDVFVQELDMHWVIVQDTHGRDPAVRLEDTPIILFPLTMISKRVERGETVDVLKLFGDIAAQVQAMLAQE